MMITSPKYLLRILVLFILVAFTGCTTPKTGLYKVGFATSDITPSDGTTYDPLLAKALVLQQGDLIGAIVVCDIMDIDSKNVEIARGLISSKTGIPAENISISCTHNHAEGDCENLAERIAQSAIDASKTLIPVVLSSGKTIQEDISFNRRFLMLDGTVRMNPGFDTVANTSFENGLPYLNKEIIRPVGPIDTDLPVIFFRSATDDKPLGSFTGFAVHVCVFGQGYSADFPGYLARELAKNYGDQFFSMYGEGTCGDINHWDVRRSGVGQNGPAKSEEIGKGMAQSIIRAVPGLNQGIPDFRIITRILDIPILPVTEMDIEWAKSAIADEFRDFTSIGFDNRGFLAWVRAHKIMRIVKMSKKGMKTFPVEIKVFKIDNQTAIVTLPGEIFVEHGLAIKAGSPFKNTIIITEANADCDYVPTLKAYGEGGYEVVSSFLVPGAGEMMVKTVGEMLREVE
jgi:hypothetical protein